MIPASSNSVSSHYIFRINLSYYSIPECFSGTLKMFEAFKTDILFSFTDLYAFVMAEGEYNLYLFLAGCGFAL